MKLLHIQLEQGFRIVAGTERSQAAIMVLAPKESTGGPRNRHVQSDQWLYVVSGQGKAIVNGQSIDLHPGSLLLIEAGENHEISNTQDTPLETINIYAPPEY